MIPQTDAEIDTLAKAWIASEAIPSDDRNEADWDVVEMFLHFADSEPEILWKLTLRVLDLGPTEDALEMLAVSPLEDLIQNHGSLFLDRVTQAATDNPSFAALLPKVWIPYPEDDATCRYLMLGCDPVHVRKSV